MQRISQSVKAFLAFTLAISPWVWAAESTANVPNTRARVHSPRTSRTHPDPLSAREQTLQLLNRFTYGPRPGEVDRVLAEGRTAWLDRQLDPSAISDSSLEARLREYATLTMSPAQALTLFPDNGTLKQIDSGSQPMPADPRLAAVYEVELLKYRRREERRQREVGPATAHKAPDQATATPASASVAPGEAAVKLPRIPELAAGGPASPNTASAEPAFGEDIGAERKRWQTNASRMSNDLLALPREQRFAALMRLPVADRAVVSTFVPREQRTLLLHDFTPYERELFLAMSEAPGSSSRLIAELSEAKVLRDIFSERQLQEVMTDFWFNHFNVYSQKESDKWYTASYERDAIRPHALGRFYDLLLATAKSPAMLVYLDNWLSTGPHSLAAVNSADKSKGSRGLNENYGRELMELHTLSVSARYTQADVTALSSIFTGWGVERPQRGGDFHFDQRRHEPGDKHWLGQTIPEGRRPDGSSDGMQEGLAALQALARSPATAQFISYRLAQRFVADNPPQTLVDRLAADYLANDGDISRLIRLIVASPEFNARRTFRCKIKTPTEFVASAFRATGTDPSNPGALVATLKQMGMAPYMAVPPTGYSLTGDHWMNSGAIVDRLAFAEGLTSGHEGNQPFDVPRLLALALSSNQGDSRRSLAISNNARPAVVAGRPVAATVAAPLVNKRGTALGESSSSFSATQSSAPDGLTVAVGILERTILGVPAGRQTEQLIRQELAAEPAEPTTGPAEVLNHLTRLLISSPDFQLR